MRILVVEDNVALLQSINQILSEEFEVDCAENRTKQSRSGNMF